MDSNLTFLNKYFIGSALAITFPFVAATIVPDLPVLFFGLVSGMGAGFVVDSTLKNL